MWNEANKGREGAKGTSEPFSQGAAGELGPAHPLGTFSSAEAAGNAVRSKRGDGCLINLDNLYHEMIGLT